MQTAIAIENKSAVAAPTDWWEFTQNTPPNRQTITKAGAVVQSEPEQNDARKGAHSIVRVVVMDDSPVLRALIVAILDDVPAIDEVLQASDAPSALALVLAERPLIAILDIKVPGDSELRNGIDVLRAIKQRAPATEVIMLTNHAIPLYRTASFDAGASWFLDKSSEFDLLPRAIDEIIGRQA